MRVLFRSTLILLLGTLLLLGHAHASLIGEMPVVSYAASYGPGWVYVNGETIFLTEETIIKMDFPEPTVVGPVVEGPSDIMSIPGGKNTGVTIDFDATGFTLAHDMVNVFFSSIPSFNGIIIDGFSGTVANSITSANGTANLFDIDGNPVPFSNDRVYYSDDAVFVNFSGLMFFDGDVEVDLIFSPVPLPSALWLFGAGIISLIGFARR